jgi:CDP-diacylglycerol--inositol 3-phosphatidyltransferase
MPPKTPVKHGASPESPTAAAAAAVSKAAAAVPASQPKAKADPTAIYFFVPNLIGYARIIFALWSFVVAFDNPNLFLVLYTLSFVLDAADGWAARLLDQCSSFGAILDMFTDRAATSAVIVVISHVVQPTTPTHVFIAALLVFLDVASHFTRMYGSMFSGKQSHKDTSDSIFTLLRIYYSNRNFMGALCVGQEFFYILYYARFFFTDAPAADVINASLYLAAPLCLLKQIVNVQQLADAMYHIAVHDAEIRAARKTK